MPAPSLPRWLDRAWDEALEEDHQRAPEPKPWHDLMRGFRLPKRGRWRLEVPRLKNPLDVPPPLTWKFGGLLGALLWMVVPRKWLWALFAANVFALQNNKMVPGTAMMYNAADFTGVGLTVEGQITAAIAQAAADGVPIVFIPARNHLNVPMLPYTASLVTFNAAVKMTREGQNPGVYDIQAYGAQATLATDQTAAIQAALDAQHNAGVGTPVWAPAGNYAITTLKYYTGTALIGEGFIGPLNAPGTQFFQTSAAAPLLQPNTPGSQTSAFLFRNFVLSAAVGNAANLGGLDCTNCTDYVVEDVMIAGAHVFGVQIVGGAVAGNAGFGHFTRVIVNNHQAGAYGWLISSSANDQPDAVTFTDCRTSSAVGTWIHYANVGGRAGPNQEWIGCSFEAVGGSATADVTFDASGSGPIYFTNCRLENTGSGGIQFVLNGFGIQPAAVFTNCLIAPGAGGFTRTDNGPILSPFVNCTIGGNNHVLTQFTSSVQDKATTLTWAASVGVDSRKGNHFLLTATSNIAATIAGPDNSDLNIYAGISQFITFEIFNNSGGALTTPVAFATGAGTYKASGGVSPANGLAIEVVFRWNQVRNLWVEVSRGVAV